MRKLGILLSLMLLASPVLVLAEGVQAPELSMAVAQNTGGTTDKEAGDQVVLSFDLATNKPVIDKDNIDSVLVLENSHSWLDGADQIGSADWSTDGKKLTVVLSAGTSLPTVDVGDKVTITGDVIKDSTAAENAKGSEDIKGSFGLKTEDGNKDNQDKDTNEDEGQGQPCANTLVNGKLYKLAGDENFTVYLAANCILKPFRGAAVFRARGGKFLNIIILDSLTGFTVSDKPALPAGGTLIKGSDKTVWFMEKGQKRKGFASAGAFLGLGFHFDQVDQISDDDLATIPEDTTPVTTDTQHPDGSLVKCGNSATVFEIIGGTKFPFASLDQFELRGHSFDHIVNVDCGRFNYVQGTAI